MLRRPVAALRWVAAGRNRLFIRAFVVWCVYLFVMERFRKYRWMILILVVAGCARLAISLDRDRWPASSDEDHWERMGLIYSTIGIASVESGSYRPPLYPLLISAVYTIIAADAFWVRVVQIGLSLATVWLVARLAFRLGGERVALIAAVSASLYPLWMFFSAMIMAEVLLVFLVTLAVYLAIRFTECPGLGLAAALGCCLGLAVLCKPIVGAWVPAVVIALWRASGWAMRKEQLNQAVAVLAGLLMAVGPWLVRNEVVTGHRFAISTNLGMNLLVGHEPQARGSYVDGRNYLAMHARISEGALDAVERDAWVASEVGRWMVENPWRTLKLAGRKTFLLWNSVLEGAPKGATAIHFMTGTMVSLLGLWGLVRLRTHTLGWLVGSAVLVWTIVHAVFFAHPRFRLPVDLLLMPFLSVQLLVCWQWVSNAVRKRMSEL